MENREHIIYEQSKEFRIKEALEEIKKDGADAPEIKLAPEIEPQLMDLFAKFDSPGQHILGVVRCWNKNEDELFLFFERIESLQKALPELAGVVLVINNEGEEKSGGETQKNLSGINNGGVLVVPLTIKKYSWTAGLNGPVALLRKYCATREIDLHDQYVFNFSFDVKFDDVALQKLAENFRAGKTTITRRGEIVEQPVSSQDTARDDLEISQKISQLISGGSLPDKDFVKVLTLGRNTGSLIKLADLIALGGFDARCNALGGMEDQDFWLRKLISMLRASDISGAKSLLRGLRKPIEFQDSAWNALSSEKKLDKYDKEMLSLHKIIERLVSLHKAGAPTDSGALTDSEVPIDPEALIVPIEHRDFNL